MKSLTVWRGHSTRPSLPAGTARKDSGHLSGRGPSILLRKTVRSLKSPTGAFIAPLRFANASLPMAGGTGSYLWQRKTGSSRLLGIRKTVFEK